jgi:hypothetical protein
VKTADGVCQVEFILQERCNGTKCVQKISIDSK